MKNTDTEHKASFEAESMLPFIPQFAGMHGDNPLAIKIIECGCCNQYHRVSYYGDCRNNEERFADPKDFEARWFGGGYPSVEVCEEEPAQKRK